jgi:signal peptidase I
MNNEQQTQQPTHQPTQLHQQSHSDHSGQSLQPVPKRPRNKKEGGILSFVSTLLVAFILVQIINLFFFQSYKVFGSSMVPTLHDGDRLIISKVGRTTSKIKHEKYQPKRGDVIVFIDPQRSDLQLIKRVIGLPGERVVVLDGKLTVYNTEYPNGFNPDDADYGKDLPRSSGENDVNVPENQIFVSGDNRAGSNSLDSRNELGTVPEENIIGTLKVRIWPFNDSRFF